MYSSTIYIIGAGAIGKALAVFLLHAGKNAVLVRGSVNDGTSNIQDITIEIADGNLLTYSVQTVTLDCIDQFEGIVLLTNKAFGNAALAGQLFNKGTDYPLVLLQNGLGIETAFIEHGFKFVYRSVLFATCQEVGENRLRFRPVKESPVGITKGSNEELELLVDRMNTALFPFSPSQDIRTIVWEKTIMNTVFNSVCPLLAIDNGIFYRSEKALQLARRLINSCVQIAQKAGITIYAEKIEDGLLKISRASDGQLISTLQDILHDRLTEIDHLNFELVRVATSLGLQEEAREIQLLGELIQLKSNKNHTI